MAWTIKGATATTSSVETTSPLATRMFVNSIVVSATVVTAAVITLAEEGTNFFTRSMVANTDIEIVFAKPQRFDSLTVVAIPTTAIVTVFFA